MAQKPSIPKGTRDFGPIEMARRNYIFETIRTVFKLYGYQSIETPAMETLQTLMGKYGEEGDRLIFRILNSGDFMADVPLAEKENANSLQISNIICEKALRYDLTVPFARFVVMHANEITFPFKRYQIQPVWRADRPQKGRYREFYQCDADIVGSNSLFNEVELVQLVNDIFNRLNLQVKIKINNRKILSGMAEIIGHPDKITDITVAIDKLDKVGMDNVNTELISKGLSIQDVEKLQPILALQGQSTEKIKILRQIFASSAIGLKGIDEVEDVFQKIAALGLQSICELDLSLARGLNYYTGAILEVKSAETEIGSICGGGRYDNLTGIFGMKNLSGVGISFGADRIYDVLLQLDRFPKQLATSTKVLVINFGGNEELYALGLTNKLRRQNISAEIYPSAEKLKKQFSYADSLFIPYVIIAGADEIKNRKVNLKNMLTGEQTEISENEAIDYLKKL